MTEGPLGSGGTLLNLSRDGCAVECGRAPRPEERLSLDLVLSEDEPAIHVEAASVRWVAGGRFGVEFLTMSAEARQRLHRFVASRLDAGVVVELRRHQRFPVRVSVAFWGAGVSGLGAVFNLSRGGCAVESDVLPPPGTTLQLYMTMPARPSSLVVDVAPVRWAAAGRFGVEFTHMQPEANGLLQQIVAKLAPNEGER